MTSFLLWRRITSWMSYQMGLNLQKDRLRRHDRREAASTQPVPPPVNLPPPALGAAGSVERLHESEVHRLVRVGFCQHAVDFALRHMGTFPTAAAASIRSRLVVHAGARAEDHGLRHPPGGYYASPARGPAKHEWFSFVYAGDVHDTRLYQLRLVVQVDAGAASPKVFAIGREVEVESAVTYDFLPLFKHCRWKRRAGGLSTAPVLQAIQPQSIRRPAMVVPCVHSPKDRLWLVPTRAALEEYKPGPLTRGSTRRDVPGEAAGDSTDELWQERGPREVRRRRGAASTRGRRPHLCQSQRRADTGLAKEGQPEAPGAAAAAAPTPPVRSLLVAHPRDIGQPLPLQPAENGQAKDPAPPQIRRVPFPLPPLPRVHPDILRFFAAQLPHPPSTNTTRNTS